MKNKNIGFIVSATILILIAAILFWSSMNTAHKATKVDYDELSDHCKINRDSLEQYLQKSGAIKGKYKSHKLSRTFFVIGDINKLQIILSSNANNVSRGPFMKCLNQCSTKESTSEGVTYSIPVKSSKINEKEYIDIPCCLIVELMSR